MSLLQIVSFVLIGFVTLNCISSNIEQVHCSSAETLTTLLTRSNSLKNLFSNSNSASNGASATATAAASSLPIPHYGDLPAAQWLPPARLPGAKKNKVSKLLHLAHDKSTGYIYSPKKSSSAFASAFAGTVASGGLHSDSAASGSEASLAATAAAAMAQASDKHHEQEPNWFDLNDDEVIAATCTTLPKKIICNQVVKVALKRSNEDKARIAAAIRHKPAHVQASKVLYNELFGLTVQAVESKGYDEKLDKMINFAATRTPYGFAAVKTLDMVI